MSFLARPSAGHRAGRGLRAQAYPRHPRPPADGRPASTTSGLVDELPPVRRRGAVAPRARAAGSVLRDGGVWLAATPAIEAALGSARADATAGPHHFLGALLHAAEHAAISLLPLHVLCDRGDLGGISTPDHPQIGCGGVFVYEGHAGGVGIAPRAFAGCPSCWQGRPAARRVPLRERLPLVRSVPKCGNGNRPLDKAGARRSLALLLGEEAGRRPPRLGSCSSKGRRS